ncbi:MAG: hypothetical protein M3O02_10580 [Acidobacteriota bacterium]|nr:hypothetical protein [Acidobacteriota bacterium]
MGLGLVVSMVVLLLVPCLLRAQTPVRLIQRQSFAAAPGGGAGALPEAPSPVWAQKEVAAEAGCGAGVGVNGEPCAARANMYSRFLDSAAPTRLTVRQKGTLALRNLVDAGNLATIAGGAAFSSMTESRTAYGRGVTGFAYSFGVGLLGDATGEFFGTFAIPSLTHEDPHYHRMPHGTAGRRVWHAVSRTVMAQSDDGHSMVNYATLGTYPITAEISNLYVPGIHGNGPSTVARILTGYATDPIDNLITEFLPDAARHIHVHVVFAQQLLNRLSADQYPTLP